MSVDKNFSATMIESMGELIDKQQEQLRQQQEKQQQLQQQVDQQQQQISWLTTQLMAQQQQNGAMLELIRALRTGSNPNLQHINIEERK